MALTEKKKISNRNWNEKAYDRFIARLPKGSKDIIDRTGDTYNSFMNKAVKEYCEARGYDFF